VYSLTTTPDLYGVLAVRSNALFHYAVDGLLFDRLTLPIEPDVPTDEIVQAFVDRRFHRACTEANDDAGVAH
jgi:hypothetical protein